MSNRLKIKGEKTVVTRTEKKGHAVVTYIIVGLIILALIFMFASLDIMS